MAQETQLGGHVIGGRYRLVRRVGEGIPALYEARHPRLSGRFAARLWPPTTPWEAFRLGAEVAATLRHPGVLQVIDFNCEPGAPPFLITEWVDATRLSEVMASSGLLAVPRVAALVESAAWALAAAHQQGVVHQQLRPEEIHVVQAAGSGREWIKLDGFGVAASLVRAGAASPSPYAAPEQALPEADDDGADPLSDQFALAALAYEMLSGVRPFEGADGHHQPRAPSQDGASGGGGNGATASLREGPALLSEIAPGVSPAVDTVIRQALAREPEERFAGVLEFARALRDAAEGVSTQVVRRRDVEGRSRSKLRPIASATSEAPVSPFFNPVQAPPAEGIRPGRLSTWRDHAVRVGGLARRQIEKVRGRLPRGVPARIGLAVGTLVVLFGSAAVLMRHPPRRAATEPGGDARAAVAARATAPAIAPAAHPVPPAPAEAAPPEGAATAAAAAAAAPVVALAAGPAGGPAAATTTNTATTAAGATGDPTPPPTLAIKRPRPARRTTQAAPATHAPAAAPAAAAALARPATPATARPAAAAAAATGGAAPCTINVGSRPWAHVWLDERDTGRKTPVTDLRVACGDHKLALKRDDLDIYQMEVITVRAGAPFKKSYPLQ